MVSVSDYVRLSIFYSSFCIIAKSLRSSFMPMVITGPSFNIAFYIFSRGIGTSLVGLLSSSLYQSYFSTWKFRSVIIFAIFFGVLSPIVDVFIIKRWNKVMGIPDTLLFVLGSAIYGMEYNFNSITLRTIFAKMSPPGMESTVNGTCILFLYGLM